MLVVGVVGGSMNLGLFLVENGHLLVVRIHPGNVPNTSRQDGVGETRSRW
jgi:hypothetical protein